MEHWGEDVAAAPGNFIRSLLDQTDSYTRMQLLLTGGQSRAQRERQRRP